MTPGAWTPDRLAVLRSDYPDASDNRALLEMINALPGAPISSVKSLGVRASQLGLRKTRDAMAAVWAAQAAAGRAASGAGRPVGKKDSAPRKPRVARDRAPRPAAPPPPPVITDPGISRYERARALIERGRDPFKVSVATGLPAWRCLGIAGEIRQERAQP